MVGATGFEPVTPAVSRQCSTTELRTLIFIYNLIYCIWNTILYKIIYKENNFLLSIKNLKSFDKSHANNII